MRAFVAGLALAFLLSATPSIALADGGGDNDVTADKPSDDPGLTALHTAIDDMRDARTALRADCPNTGDAKCRADFKKVREAFKDAHDKAIEAHHAFKDAEKKARDEAKQKAKDALKDKAENAREHAKDKAKDNAGDHATKPNGSPTSPAPSATPRG